MKSSRFLDTLIVVITLLLMTVCLTACIGESDIVSRAWIDFPINDSEVVVGNPVSIIAQLYAREGVGEYQISVNGEIITQGPPSNPEEDFSQINYFWVPEQPGQYSIVVSILDKTGIATSKAQVDITVIGELELPPPDLTITGVSLVDGDRIQCDYSNLGGAALPTGRDVWLDIFVGPTEVEFVQTTHSNIGVDRLFEAGDTGSFTSAPISPAPLWPQLVSCVIDAGNLVAENDEDNNEMQATLGPSITSTDTPPPTSSPTFTPPPSTFTATLPPTYTWTPVPPTFTPTTPPPPPSDTPVPPDTTPPNISNMQASESSLIPSPCQPNTVNITVQVSDASGISEVKLYFRVVRGGQPGEWQVYTMNHLGGDQYQSQIGPQGLKASMTPYDGSILAFYVKAWDNNGNVAQNTPGNLNIGHCVQ